MTLAYLLPALVLLGLFALNYDVPKFHFISGHNDNTLKVAYQIAMAIMPILIMDVLNRQERWLSVYQYLLPKPEDQSRSQIYGPSS